MGEVKRFDVFFEKHIGLGLRWDTAWFPLQLSLAILCVTITVGFGKRKVHV